MGVEFERFSAKKIVDTVRRSMLGPLHPGSLPLDIIGAGFTETDQYLAFVTGNALRAGHEARWAYAHHPIKFTDDTATETTKRDEDDPRAGTTSAGYAINLYELAHIAEPGAGVPWYVWGVDVHGTDYPANTAPRPVGGGGTDGTHKVDVPVLMHIAEDPDGNAIKWFAAMGSHDGTC